jgi:FMN phosphatase YigB (HAD superfamily)
LISFLLSDLDGVIRHFPVQRDGTIESTLGIPGGLVAKLAFTEDLLSQVTTGKISDSEWRWEITRRLALKVGENSALLAVSRWSESPGEIDTEILEIILAEGAKRKVCLLTNATDRLRVDLNTLGISRRFHRIFNSSEIGFAKPGVEVFDKVRLELGCTFQEMAFVDDAARNVEMARSLGIRSHQFLSGAGLKSFLREL